jgi:hypothetical protein
MPGMDGMFIAKHFRLGTPAKLDISFLEHESHHCQATDSVAGTDSFCLSGGADSDPASFSQQAPTVDLQRTGVVNPRQRGIALCHELALRLF